MTKQLQPVFTLTPGANLDSYIYRVNSIPVLSIEDERRLANDFFYHNNLDAAKQLVMSHLRFVVSVAKSYAGYGLAEADLIQEGNVGLMKAVKRFDPNHGVRLVSFAVHWIKAEIHEFILRNWRIVKIATTKAQRKLFFNLRSHKKKVAWLNTDEVNDVANSLSVTPVDVREMESRLVGQDITFEAYNNDDDELSSAPVHYLEDNRYNPADLVEHSSDTGAQINSLYLALEKLDDRSRDILEKRWLAEEKSTLQDLASKYNVSVERIRQIEKTAMDKIKKIMN